MGRSEGIFETIRHSTWYNLFVLQVRNQGTSQGHTVLDEKGGCLDSGCRSVTTGSLPGVLSQWGWSSEAWIKAPELTGAPEVA